MLVITRRIGESFHVGDDVKVVILDSERNQVKIGIKAPRDVEVHREEIFQRIKQEKAAGGSDRGGNQ